MSDTKNKRNFLSTSNKNNLIVLLLGLTGIFVVGGPIFSFPSQIAILIGILGLIKNNKINKKDSLLPYSFLILIVLTVLGLISVLSLVILNPAQHLNN